MLRGDTVKDDSGWYAVCTEQGSSALQMTAAKVMDINHIKTTRMRRTSSSGSIRLHPGQNGRCTIIVENSKIGMSRYLDTSPKAQMAQIMVQYGRSSRSSSANSVRSSFSRTFFGKGNSRKFQQNTVGKKFQIWNVQSLTEKKDHSCLCTGRCRTGWKETEHRPNVENTHERL